MFENNTLKRIYILGYPWLITLSFIDCVSVVLARNLKMFFKKSKKVNDELQQELQKLREENEKLKGTIVDWRDHCRQIQDHNDLLRQERDHLRRDLDYVNDAIAEQRLEMKQILQLLKDHSAKIGLDIINF